MIPEFGGAGSGRYPLKLVMTDSHVFARWDGKTHPNAAWRDRFNIEGAGRGFGSYDDEYYMTWPKKITAHQVRANGYLVSLTPKEELAMFLGFRAHCGVDNGQAAFAARCLENAYRCDPRRPCYRTWFLQAAGRIGYHPVTPALARLLAREQRLAAVRRQVVNRQTQMPSEVAAAMARQSGQRHTPRVRPWRPQPVTPGVPHPPTPPQPHGGMPTPYQPPAPPAPQTRPPQPYQHPVPSRPPR